MRIVKLVVLADEAMAFQCAWCKKFRIDDKWVKPTAKLRALQRVSHGICPPCYKQWELDNAADLVHASIRLI